jgi:hypothetical protein
VFFTINQSDHPEGKFPIPSPKELLRIGMVSDTAVEMCFPRSFSCIDRSYLDTRPDNSMFTVRTALKNVVANGMVIWMKHSACEDFRLKEDALRAIHSLDTLTPAPAFMFPLNPLSASISRRKRKTRSQQTMSIQIVGSDGEEYDQDVAF